MKKTIKGILVIILAMILTIVGEIVQATNADIVPPKGSVSITGATVVDNINYVENLEVQVKINVSDDVSASNKVKMYITTNPIQKDVQIPENSWETYSATKNMTLVNAQEINTIYAIFKDEAGNISEIFSGDNVRYDIVYDANGGTKAPESQKAYFGMSVKLTNDRPEKEGMYFLGWSTNKEATTASYGQGSIITANSFKGANKNITLYAVWTNEISSLPSLSTKVKVGDYVNYPVAYSSVKSEIDNSYCGNRNGWRVISVDVDLDGNASPGTVNLVSAGVPLAYLNTEDVSVSFENLTEKILKLDINRENTINTSMSSSISENYISSYTNSGFLQGADLVNMFSNKYTALNSNNEPYTRALDLKDIARVTGVDVTEVSTTITPTPSVSPSTSMKEADEKTVIDEKDITDETSSTPSVTIIVADEDKFTLGDEIYEGLFYNGSSYILASIASGNLLWAVTKDALLTKVSNAVIGVRPVVSLRSTVKTTGFDRQGIWDIEEYDRVTVSFVKDDVTQTRKNFLVGTTYDLASTSKTGYTFLGWYTQKSGGTKVTTQTTITENKNHNLYANFEPKEITITFNANGGTVSQSNKTVRYGEEYGELPTPVKLNAEFIGWYTSATGGTKILPSTKVNSTSNKTLYAQWAEQSIEVTLEPNGGTVSPTSIIAVIGEKYGTLPTPVREGYTFDGWYTTISGTTKVTATSTVDSTSTLYAHWNAREDTKYEVYHYLANITSGYTLNTLEERSGKTGQTITLAEKAISIIGGTYSYGSIEEGGVAVTSTTINADGSTKIYLYYSRNSYSLTLSKDAKVSSVTGAGTYLYGENVSINAVMKTKTTNYVYNFKEWQSSDINLLSNLQSQNANFTMPAGAITLTATGTQVARTIVQVSFDANGGTVSQSQKDVYLGEAYGTLPIPTNGNRNFLGWYTERTNGEQITETTVVTTTSAHTLYAHYDAEYYTVEVIYDSSEGTVTPGTIQLAKGSNQTFVATSSSAGYSGRMYIFEKNEKYYMLNPNDDLNPIFMRILATGEYTITNISYDYVIKVVFLKNKPTPTPTPANAKCYCENCDTGKYGTHECSDTICRKTACYNCDEHYTLCGTCGRCWRHCECEEDSGGGSSGGSGGGSSHTCPTCGGTGFSCAFTTGNGYDMGYGKCPVCGSKEWRRQGCTTHMWADSRCPGCNTNYTTSPANEGCMKCSTCKGKGIISD